jgi:hypothetical protein
MLKARQIIRLHDKALPKLFEIAVEALRIVLKLPSVLEATRRGRSSERG